jgi:hypothetical protein
MNEPDAQQNASPQPESSPWWRQGWFQGAAIFALALVGMLYYQFVPEYVPVGERTELRRTNVGLPDVDSYYHVKMGWLYRTGEAGEAGENFHWTRESTWSDTFSDKDYLFHLYLIPFTVGVDDAGDVEGLVLAGKWGVSVLGALLVLTLFVVMRRFGVKYALLYTLCFIAVGGTYWVFRLNMCRSYLISIMLALVGWHLIARGRRIALLLLATVFTLAYTASHLLFAMLLVRAVMELFMGPRPGSTRRKDLKSNVVLGACILGGIALGCALHPHSLELVELWWVQNVVVMALSHQDTVAPVIDNVTALFGHHTDYTNSVEIQLGRELASTDGRAAVLGTPLLFFAPMLLPLAAALLGWRPTREAVLTATISVVWLVGYMLNGRFIEYATPFMALAIALWGTHLMQTETWKGWLEKRPVIGRALPISAAVVAMIAGLSMWIGAARSYRALDCGDIELAGLYLHEHPETHGKVVWHDRWDDFPQLLFFASECDYLIGLDPTFFLVHDEEKYKLWTEIRRGKKRDFVDTIRDEFKADYILAHRSSSEFFYNRLTEEARAGRLKLLIREQTDEWALYEINPRPPSIP